MGSVAVSSSMTKGKSSRSSLSGGIVGAAISSFCSHGDEVFLLDVSLSLVTDITSVSFFDKSKGCSIIDGFSGSAKGTRAGGIFDSLRSLARQTICLYFAYLYDTSRKIDVIGDHDDLLLFRSRIDGIITFQNSKLFIIYERPSSDSSTVVVLSLVITWIASACSLQAAASSRRCLQFLIFVGPHPDLATDLPARETPCPQCPLFPQSLLSMDSSLPDASQIAQ
ncbi:hypothetical protein ALC60_04474 [Trachymyrmex zeteki]|uniref:Uncharacterized protein n=1 Tax=Mycetomoellerius zeteki TaxID=64791 RepID=A0A151X8K6_9HYME|nr:hypothetical protein ALC60_04474 [Trachymyrmex zeteki]